MTLPRSALISYADTPWYHLVNRCVRLAFLCGSDAQSEQSYEHRRGWIADRLHHQNIEHPLTSSASENVQACCAGIR